MSRKPQHTTDAPVRRELYRIREGAIVLSVSERQVLKFVRAGLLHIVRIPGIRAARLSPDEVHALAATWKHRDGKEANH